MQDQVRFNTQELMDQLHEGLTELGNNSQSLQMRLNYTTKLQLKLICSYYNTTQSKFIRSAISNHFNNLLAHDQHFKQYADKFSEVHSHK